MFVLCRKLDRGLQRFLPICVSVILGNLAFLGLTWPRSTVREPTLICKQLLGLETPMLEDADEGGIKLWHLVKPTEEPELPKHRRGSLRDRERAKAIPEIYLTRLLSMKVRRSTDCVVLGILPPFISPSRLQGCV